MAKQNAAGCGGWIVAGFLLVALIGQCGKDPAPTTSTNVNGLMSSGSDAADTSKPTRWLYVQADTLNCRGEPSASASKIEGLSSNAFVEEIDEQGGWSQLRRPGADCWVKTSYLDQSPRPEPVRRSYRPTSEARGLMSSTGSSTAYYRNCSAARAAGAAPVLRGEPGYSRRLDRDGDGVGCE